MEDERATRVVILAGGLGTRIRARFPDLPKPLIPIHGRPFLEWQIELMVAQGLRELVLCISYRADEIAARLGDGAALGARIAYAREATPLGTAGALRNAAALLGSPSLVLNGDTYLVADYPALLAEHRRLARDEGVLASLVLAEVSDAGRYGTVLLDGDAATVTGFAEKRALAEPGLVNAGAYLLEPGVLEWIPDGRPASLELEVFPALAAARRLRGLRAAARFFDMGTPDGYDELCAALRDRR